MRIKVRAGLDLQLGDRPATKVEEHKGSSRAGLLGRDFSGVKFDVKVEPGMRIQAGEAVACDRHRPGIMFVAPMGGVISAVNQGKRRSLLSVIIDVDQAGDESKRFDVPDRLHRDAVRQLMLNSGLWTAIRKRPFGDIPDSDRDPRALLVTAVDTDPLAPDPIPIIRAYAHQFALGLEALSAIYDGPLYLCQPPAADIASGSPDRVQRVEFIGPHPAGLPGTHIHFLCPIGFDRGEVWHIGYQDVIALGHLLNTGKLWLQRVVMLAGPAVAKPRVLTVPLAAATGDLVCGELAPGAVRVISGSALSGHTAEGAEAFLSQRHRQITVLPEVDSILTEPQSGGVCDTGLGGNPGPLIPVARLQRLSPPGILAVPLMRALLVNDIDLARDLGALELVEEDLALLTYGCPSKSDYGRLLRTVLEQLRKEMA